jgi:hypothetical protein
MTSLRKFHSIAALCGDGLRPELQALFQRLEVDPHSELLVRNDGMVQSGPDPVSAPVHHVSLTARRPDSCARLGERAPGDQMVDLTQYARSLESDLAYVREKLALLEAGTVQEGLRKPGHEWVDISAPTILLYKRIIVTYEAALIAVNAKLGATSAP